MSSARDLLDGFLDLFLPKRCVQCGAVGQWLCPSCRGQLKPLDGAACRRCGRPAPPAAGADGSSCPECAGRELGFAAAAAAFMYEGPARRLVTACKFRPYKSLAAEMAALAAPRFQSFAGDHPAHPPVDVVTWVPVHRERRLERGFNQAELLARELARSAGLPCEGLLTRTRQGPRQSELPAGGRAANVRGAFAAAPRAATISSTAKRVVVIDDVYTTGETLSECSSTLASAGWQPRAFTFARTVRDHRLLKMRANGVPGKEHRP